jgi:hypothetical protein
MRIERTRRRKAEIATEPMFPLSPQSSSLDRCM